MSRKQLTCNSCVFYGSFYEAVSLLPLESQGKVYDAIFKFAFENIEIEMEGVELAVFLLIKPQLIANRTKYENGCKGGRPKKDESNQKPSENRIVFENDNVINNQIETESQAKVSNAVGKMDKQNKTETKPSSNLDKIEGKPNENDNVNDNINVKERNKQREKVQNDKIIASEALSLYNALCDNLVKCTELTKKRQKIISNCSYSVDRLKEIFKRANKSSFLRGNNHRGFRANFDWLMNKDNAVKVLEGMYDNVPSEIAKNSQIISDRHNYSQDELDTLFCKTTDESVFVL